MKKEHIPAQLLEEAYNLQERIQGAKQILKFLEDTHKDLMEKIEVTGETSYENFKLIETKSSRREVMSAPFAKAHPDLFAQVATVAIGKVTGLIPEEELEKYITLKESPSKYKVIKE